MPRMVLCADFSLAAVAMLGLLNVACSNDRASTSHYSSMLVSYGAMRSLKTTGRLEEVRLRKSTLGPVP